MNTGIVQDRPLFILAIDHRVDFLRELIGAQEGLPTAAERERAAQLKQVAYEGLVKAIEEGLPKSNAGIWTDTDLGEAVLLRARQMSLATAFSVEIPRSDSLRLETVADIPSTASRFGARFVAARVPYVTNIGKDAKDARDSALHLLSKTCSSENLKLMLEPVLIPPDGDLNGTQEITDWAETRPLLTLQAITELQNAGVEPSAWVVEPPPNARAAATLSGQVHIDDRNLVSIFFSCGRDPGILRSGKQTRSIEKAVVKRAAKTLGVGGLLVGPGAYFRPLALYNSGETDRTAAITAISEYVQDLNEIFSDTRRTVGVS